MVFNCNINAFSNLTSIIYLYNENMNLEMTIKKLGSVYKFRVGRATGKEHIFLFGLICSFPPILLPAYIRHFLLLLAGSKTARSMLDSSTIT